MEEMAVKNASDSRAAKRGHAGVLAITGVTIIDGNGGAPIDSGVILIHGKRIAAVGDHSIAIPPHAEQIDARGKFAIPGLMDPHVDLVPGFWPPDLIRCEGRYDEVAIEAAQLALKGGITTVFEAAGPRDPVLKARNAINEGRTTAARIYLCGNYVGIGGPLSPDFYDHGDKYVGEESPERKWAHVTSATDAAFKARVNALWEVNVGEALTRMPLEEVREEVLNYIHSGIDYVTYLVNAHRLGAYQYIALSPRVQGMIVEEAHRAGLPVMAFFASTDEGVQVALDAGADIIMPAPLGGERPMSAETLARIAQSGVFVHIVPKPAEAVEWYRRQTPTAGFPGLAKAFVDMNVDACGLIRAGVRIISAGFAVGQSAESHAVLSSGHPPGTFPQMGEGHVMYMPALQDCGMSPMDTLMAATRNVARAFKVDKDLGTLERGKLADLVMLDRDPLRSTENYRSISIVMKEGEIIDRETLPTQRLITSPSVEPI
jgi:imidazolonepropionase-like amidohydrolase